MSNPMYKGIYKVGQTKNDVSIRKNQLYTTGVILPFKIEFVKELSNFKEKENVLHDILSKYGKRINPKREFFEIPLDEIYKLFELLEGTFIDINDDNEEDSVLNEDEDEDEFLPCRDTSKVFEDKTKIRHVIKNTSTIEGVFDKQSNSIIYNDNHYTLGKFASLNYKTNRPDRTSKCNAWLECECYVNGMWISTYNLKPLL